MHVPYLTNGTKRGGSYNVQQIIKNKCALELFKDLWVQFDGLNPTYLVSEDQILTDL